MNKRICAVVVTYNRLEVLKQSLAHIMSQTIKLAAIVIVDNNSSDGTKEYLEFLKDDKNIHCVYLNDNIGYAGGIAHGMKYGFTHSSYDYFWIMDDDSYHQKDTLKILLDSIDNTPYDIVGSVGFKMKYGIKKLIEVNEKIQDADFILIDGALVKADVFTKIGAPDEKYFMMCEDYEYCKRLKKNNLNVGLTNIEAINRLHLGGDGKFTQNTLWRGYYHSRNHMLILKQYFSFSSLFGYVLTQSKFIIAAAIFAPDRMRRVKFRIIGIWHGLKGIKGKTLDPKTLKFKYDLIKAH